ncbi:MAG: HAD domain-containing protein [Nitrososphaera sp.]|jgi:hypothetical protein
MAKGSLKTGPSQESRLPHPKRQPLNKVLFLDIDGVLFLGLSSCSGLYNSDPLNKECVRGLNEIIEKTGCSIVITSSWQNEYTLEQLQEIFAWNGIRKVSISLSVADARSLASHGRRAQEILDWLSAEANTSRTESPDFRWCVVDDMDLGELPNFVKCDPNIGLKDHALVLDVVETLNS